MHATSQKEEIEKEGELLWWEKFFFLGLTSYHDSETSKFRVLGTLVTLMIQLCIN